MLNVIAIMGRLVADPELRQTPQGLSVVTFRIACERDRADQNGQRQADFIDVTAWRQTAEFICKYFQKGSLIALEGRLQTRNYQDKNGNNRTAFEIVANNVSFVGGKNTSGGGQGGNYAPAYASAPQQQYGHPAPQEMPSYSAGSNDDFAVIDDNEDLPF